MGFVYPKQTRLTWSDDDNTDPTFSPDGTKILFDSDYRGNLDIWVMNADGSQPERLTQNPQRSLYG